MKVSAELSLYPIRNQHRPIIDSFIAELEKHDVEIITGTMSTRLFGDADKVWKAISDAFAKAGGDGLIALNIKILNTDLRPASEPFGSDSPYHQ